MIDMLTELVAPWAEGTYGLVTLLDLLRFDSSIFVSRIQGLQNGFHYGPQTSGRPSLQKEELRALADIAQDIGSGIEFYEEAPVFRRVFDRLVFEIEHGDMPWDNINHEMAYLARLLVDELQVVCFLRLSPEQSRLYLSDPETLLGGATCDRFPSLVSEAVESAKCLALGRGTASVFHIMRAMEGATQAAADSLGYNSSTQNPQQRGVMNYLKHIDSCVNGTVNPSVAHWPASKAFFVDVHACGRAFMLAWRHTTMHLETVYTVERADEIMKAIKAFLGLIAMHVDETGLFVP